MLEATSAQIFYIPFTAETDEARRRGGLKTNSFLRLRVRSEDGHRKIEIEDYGQSEASPDQPPVASGKS